jgi:hypothetical protein
MIMVVRLDWGSAEGVEPPRSLLRLVVGRVVSAKVKYSLDVSFFIVFYFKKYLFLGLTVARSKGRKSDKANFRLGEYGEEIRRLNSSSRAGVGL